MNLDELRSAQAKERRKDSLQHLRDSFYDDVAAYVEDLRAARDRRADQVAKPFSDDDVRRMSDEVETAEEVAEALYERRVGKVVKLASFAAADMPVDADGMTTEERQLFDDLVDRISENKSRVLDVLSGEVTPGDASPDATPPDEKPRSGEAVSADRQPSTPSEDGRSRSDSAPIDGRNLEDASEAASTADEPGALAGAMGGSDGSTGDEATDNDDPTAVPPEPAPPGAPGVSDDDATDAMAPDGSHALGSAVDSTSDAPGTGPDTSPSSDPATGSSSDPATGSSSDSASTPDAGSASDGDLATIKITRDIGEIFGVDEREYDLASEDVVTLPVENADPLVQRDAAERLD